MVPLQVAKATYLIPARSSYIRGQPGLISLRQDSLDYPGLSEFLNLNSTAFFFGRGSFYCRKVHSIPGLHFQTSIGPEAVKSGSRNYQVFPEGATSVSTEDHCSMIRDMLSLHRGKAWPGSGPQLN